ncbi:MAG: glycine cleavage system aminomethyltransferase GcvT [Desulfonauticus sp.]|nr:glycine cleavage system aminomethyltransferase GcvT [Desulfonauticus sp.]
MPLQQTPLAKWHKNNNAKMMEFGGWEMPLQYEGILKEHKHCRDAVCIFDISHMGEFIVSGPKAKEELSLILTHDFSKLVPGKCKYGFMLNERGGVIDDLIVYELEPEKFMIVVNAARMQIDFNWLKQHLKSSQIENKSFEIAKIDVQGPNSIQVIEQTFKQNFHSLTYFSFLKFQFQDVPILLSRTGYTGELGYEIYLPWDKAEQIWTLLLTNPLVKPAGLGARDTLRLEVGLPLYGQELDENHTPVEAGYGFLITSSANFIGKEHLNNIKEKLIPLNIHDRRSPRHNDKVFLEDRIVGRITSGSFAPSLNHSIALAYVDKHRAEHNEFTINQGKRALTGVKTTLPFYKKGTARIKLT